MTGRPTRRPWLALALLALLVAHAPVAQAAASQPAALQWWGPTAIGDGFHLRVGATVSNTGSASLPNPAVSLELDIGAALAAAGWTNVSLGDGKQLRGFHLDPQGVRVVGMTDLLPPAAGTSHGLLRALDTAFPPGDLRRYEAPSEVYEGSFTRLVQFHAGVNPTVTVVWRLGETLPAGATRSFMVYFDSDLSSDPKPAPDHEASLAGGDAESLFWSGPGMVLHGLSVPISGRGLPLHVIALQPSTTVEVLTALPGQAFQRLDQFRIDEALSEKQVPIPGTARLLVKVVADKPVVAQMLSTGFAPSVDAGMSGRDFVFALTHQGSWEQDTLYFKSTDPTDGDGALDPTVVEVTRLADGSVYLYTLSSAGGQGNPWNYTVGPRAALDAATGCVRPIAGASSPAVPFGPGLYRARVLSGERVLMQHQAVDGLAQVPTLVGAPAGSRFWTALPWSDEVGRAGSCEVRVREGTMYATTVDGPATLTATSPEMTFQAFPRGAPNPATSRFPPGRALAADGSLQGPFDVTARDSADRMLAVSTTAPIVLFAGQAPQQVDTTLDVAPFARPFTQPVATPAIHGPLGGQSGGRHFTGSGSAVVVALFDGTEVEVDSRFATGPQTSTVRLAKDSSLLLEGRSASDPLLDYVIRSNLPIVVHPATASSGTLAGVPALLPAVAQAASFRGYLVDLSSEDGDPATRSTPPGTPVGYRVTLVNLARAADGSGLADTVALTHDAPAGWTVLVDGIAASAGQARNYNLAARQERDLAVSVQPPANAPIDTTGIVTLTATSLGNERVRDTLQLVTFVKTLFEIEAWFDGVEGPKEQERSVVQGAATYAVVVQNRGSKSELVDLKVEFKGTTAQGWQAQLGPDLGTTMQVELPPAPAALEVPLRLLVPPAAFEGEATAIVTASLADVPSAKDTVQAIAALSPPSSLNIEAPVLTAFIDAGGRAVFDVVLRNEGGGTTVQLEAQGSAAQGWSAPRVTIASQEESEVSLAKGEEVTLRLSVDAASSLLSGAIDLVRFGAVADDGASVEQVFLAQIRSRHALEIVLPPQPMATDPGGQDLSVPVRIRNAGNLDEVLRIVREDVPPGWNVSVTPELLVRRGATQQVQVTVDVPDSQPPGIHNVTLRLVSRDGNHTFVRLRVQIDDTGRADVTGPGALEAQPGQRRQATFPVTNLGNTPLEASVREEPGEPWALVDAPTRRLEPGETGTLTLAWQVPADAPDGSSQHRARIEFASGSGEPVPAQSVVATIDVGRADLTIRSASAGIGPAGTLVRVTLANLGNRAAGAFDVDLLAANGALVDRVRIGLLQPGATLNVSLVLPSGTEASLAVDSGKTVVESDEDNNGMAVEAKARRDVPVPPLLGFAALAAAVALRRKRR